MQSICSKGNEWASNYYEANIASSFQRPCKLFTREIRMDDFSRNRPDPEN